MYFVHTIFPSRNRTVLENIFENILETLLENVLLDVLETFADFTGYCALDGDRVGIVVKVLYYKSGGRWFDSRWFNWNFH